MIERIPELKPLRVKLLPNQCQKKHHVIFTLTLQQNLPWFVSFIIKPKVTINIEVFPLWDFRDLFNFKVQVNVKVVLNILNYSRNLNYPRWWHLCKLRCNFSNCLLTHHVILSHKAADSDRILCRYFVVLGYFVLSFWR